MHFWDTLWDTKIDFFVYTFLYSFYTPQKSKVFDTLVFFMTYRMLLRMSHLYNSDKKTPPVEAVL